MHYPSAVFLFFLFIYRAVNKREYSRLVISKLTGPSETLQDISNSICQIFRIEENTTHTTKFQK